MHGFLRIGMVILGAVAAYQAIRIAVYLLYGGRQTQIELELNTSKARNDFLVLFQGEAVLFAGFIVFTIGRYMTHHMVAAVGELFVLTSFIAPIIVMQRWYGRLVA